VGCHNGQPYQQGDQSMATIDLRAKRLHAGFEGPYSPAYLAMQQYVRRPGFEGDYHMPKPAEYEADTSHLIQLLKKGHYNVRLSAEQWERLYTWIDFNVPYAVNWRESHRPPRDDQVERRAKYKQLYAGIEDRDEKPLPLPPIGAYEPPSLTSPRPQQPLKLAGWPLSADEARALQQKAGATECELDLGDNVKMPFALVPAGKFVMGSTRGFDDECTQQVVQVQRPFYMGRFEVTNRQYARFDPAHNSGVINERWKDRSRRGTPIDGADLPVVRITWHQALAFCEWLSAKTGQKCTLPTEAQWEWACRAGTDTDYHAGDYTRGMPAFANIADSTASGWNHGRAEPGYSDSVMFTGPSGRFAPNRWGLNDMHGNVAEWCLSAYRPYPYNAADGRDALNAEGPKVVRGGSWNDTLRFATSASRWRYQPYKPVYNVGFRVAFHAALQPEQVADVKGPSE
jgi:formylglycine-generating enzyme required for sulfatase activity